MKTQILELVTSKPKHFSTIIKHDAELNQWVLDNSLIASDNYAEMIYSAVHQLSNQCPRGNTQKFKSFALGFGGCGPANVCACNRESVSANVSKSKQSYTAEQKSAINEKRVETTLKKYNVTNVGQTAKALQAHKEFYADNVKVDAITQHIKKVKLERHGNPNFNNIEQIKETLKKKILPKPCKPKIDPVIKNLSILNDMTSSKYQRWYRQIIEKNACSQKSSVKYTESHHILPKSLGGSDLLENLVELSAREHFICHWLLTKIFKTGQAHWKMLNALRMMRTKNKYHERYHTLITARVYENLKTEYAALQSILLTGEGNGFYGKHHTEEAKRRISAANKGRIQPPEEKAKQIAAFTSKKKLPLSAEHKEKS